MPAAADASAFDITGEGDGFAFSGALTREHVARAWQACGSGRVAPARIDLARLTHLDSAGLALLSCLVQAGCAITHPPPALDALRAAHRLDEALRPLA